MGWFDAPAVRIRKLIPDQLHTQLNQVENFARHRIDSEPLKLAPYQLGIVLALWAKAGELSGEIALTQKSAKKIQSVYESCVRTIKSDASVALSVMEDLAEQGGTFGVPVELYTQLKTNFITM